MYKIGSVSSQSNTQRCCGYGLRTAAGDVGQVAIGADGSAVEPGLRCPVA